MDRQIAYSVIIPTYRRPDTLRLCLEHIAQLDYPLEEVEVLLFDNGAPRDSRSVAEPFCQRLSLTYTLNDPGHGLGYSLRRGLTAARGNRIVEINDDALVPPHFLKALDSLFALDPTIGVVGVRAIEDQYARFGRGIGTIDPITGEVVGNFDQPSDGPVDVDHVYGFCYAYTRQLVDSGARHDEVLLSRDYSSGNRLETDHCLTARRLGFRVVYDGRLAVRHLARPRGDVNEKSLRWKLNHTRNTLYLFLKHYGLLGKQGLALRFTLLYDLGLRSALRYPSWANLLYFLTGLRPGQRLLALLQLPVGILTLTEEPCS